MYVCSAIAIVYRVKYINDWAHFGKRAHVGAPLQADTFFHGKIIQKKGAIANFLSSSTMA
ncbi:hypothetical protein [Coleofasciculus sp. G2-EDA-02]|uniref:hypothetical protein n=1 Tax=Coleofasciculus sp. G2-EDA-02 TaxID=3069529 RepID=UPI0033003713